MKAAVIEKPGVLKVWDIPQPVMGEYDALCELLYGATCTGTDRHLIHGRFPWGVDYPTVLGHESIGRVVEVGAQVRHFRVGDLVTRVGTVASPTGDFNVNWGGYAEYGLARDHWAMARDGRPAAEWAGSRWNQVLPPDFDPAAATMMTTWRETLSYVNRLHFKPGATMLVIGSGGNGLSFAGHAANLGAARVAVIGSKPRETVARLIGVTDFFDYHAADLSAAVRAAFPHGFDFIIDAVGKHNSLDDALPFVKRGGTAGIYGIDEYNAQAIHPERAPGTFTYAKNGYDEAETHQQVIDFVRLGKLDAGHWLTNLAAPIPLECINDAFAALERREMVKAVVKLS
jgi:D-arabinose 1-dehydrogenase-like Zn-dependent alcohol dehydrogenase